MKAVPMSLLLVSLAAAAQAQTGIECQSPDGRRHFFPGTNECPLGLSPAPPQRPAVTVAPQKAAFLARSASEMAAIQEALIGLGLLAGVADGLYGPATEAAVRQWQRSKGLPETGYLPDEQIALLRRGAEPVAERPGAAAPAPFRCPAVGSVFVYQLISDAREREQIGSRIALGGSGLACFYLARGPAFGPYDELAVYGGFWRVQTEPEIEFARALQADRLWPAEVGKSISVTFPPAGGIEKRDVVVKVERLETVETPAGRFAAVVCSMRDRMTADGRSTDTTSYFWWAPELGEVVKATTRDAATGAEQGWQVSDAAIPQR